jgi:hypothetical protein
MSLSHDTNLARKTKLGIYNESCHWWMIKFFLVCRPHGQIVELLKSVKLC